MYPAFKQIPHDAALLRLPARIVFPRSPLISVPPSIYRAFSTTRPRPAVTLRRKRFYGWVRRVGRNFLKPVKGGTNYVTCYNESGQLIRDQGASDVEDQTEDRDAGSEEAAKNEKTAGKDDGSVSEEGPNTKDRKAKTEKGKDSNEKEEIRREDLQPFPQNPVFRSEAVLSTEMRDEIYARVMASGKTIRQVSQEMQVEMRRVAAVVRMKTMEQNWIKESKPLALRYQASMLSMLPLTPLRSDREALRHPHESINQLLVHNATRPQLFYPTHETHQFTRADAAKLFKKNLLPADERIPHPDMVKRHRETLHEGVLPIEMDRRKAEFYKQEVVDMKARKEREEQRQERHRERIEGKRWQFVFQDVRTEDAGTKGRGRRGVGWRYGRPHMDRRKGEIKIATKIET